MSINRQVMEGSLVFEMRGENVKWPTMRGAYLTNDTVAFLRDRAIKIGKSIVFLDGTYKTNLNKWVKKDPLERAVFFEWQVRDGTQMFFALCWVGNFHNGSIFHVGYQFPHSTWWTERVGQDIMERWSWNIYRHVAECLYSLVPEGYDTEVEKFLNGDRIYKRL